MWDDDRDSFWDLEKLVPRKRPTPLSAFSSKEKTSEVVIQGGGGEDSAQRRLTMANMAITEKKADVAYGHDRGLIKRVTVRHTPDKYDFHANFAKAALLYYDFPGEECPFEKYYSYMPQYTQLTPKQKSYYFYWRSMVRKGKYIKTDYSYFYLYIYELINLPEKMSRKEALSIMLCLWREYRKSLPQIDANMSLWVQDMCLVYGLPSPINEIKDFVFDTLGGSGFKEFYLSDAESAGNDGVGSMLAYLSDYDWRRGRYAGGDGKAVYSRHLLGAMALVLGHLLHSGKISFEGDMAVMERTAFRSALCTAEVKYRLVVEYRRISEDGDIRQIVTSAIKYTENHLRALMGVKSRLAVKGLGEAEKRIIDDYFAHLYHKVNKERQKASRPEYEKLYEAETTALSISGADEIERASWYNTARLVVEESDEISASPSVVSAFEEDKEDNSREADEELTSCGLSDNELRFLAGIFHQQGPEVDAALAAIMLPIEAVVDRINEAFADSLGDVVLEECDGGYAVIEDYREDVEKCLIR